MERLACPTQEDTGLQPPQQLGPLRAGTYAESGVCRSDPGDQARVHLPKPLFRAQTRLPLAYDQSQSDESTTWSTGLQNSCPPRIIQHPGTWISVLRVPRGVFKSLVLFLFSSNPCVLSPPPSNPRPLRIPASNPYPCFSNPLDSPFGLPRSTQKSTPSNATFLGSQFRCFSKSSLLYLQGTKLNLKLTAYLWVHVK